jgi:citrate lyase subunit beta/citryl-CoA lyase
VQQNAVAKPIGLRRSKLVAKGGTWQVIAAAATSCADIVHIELEASLGHVPRAEAVETVRRSLEEMDWSGKEAWVRFRHVDAPGTAEEIARVLPGRPHLVYCAKVRTAEDIRKLDRVVSEAEDMLEIPQGSTQIGAVIERVEALAQVEAIAAASPRMGALMFGANDMSLDFGYRRSGIPGEDDETLMIRSRMVLAGRLAKIDILDCAYMNRGDHDGAELDAQYSARLGFTGKNALTTDQLEGIHRAFVPVDRELIWAREVVVAAAHPDPAQRLVDDDPIDEADLRRAQILIARAG